MNIIRSSSLSIGQKESVYRLWNNEYPVQLTFQHINEFENYLRVLSRPVHYIALNGTGTVCGWAVVFERDYDRWFALIIACCIQNQGLGSLILNRLQSEEHELNGWITDHDDYTKRDNSPYRTPKGFYLKNGFTVYEESRLETEKLSAVKIKWNASDVLDAYKIS